MRNISFESKSREERIMNVKNIVTLLGVLGAFLAINHTLNGPVRRDIDKLEKSVKEITSSVNNVNIKIERLDKGQEMVIKIQEILAKQISNPTMDRTSMAEFDELFKEYEVMRAETNLPGKKADPLADNLVDG